MKNEKSADRGIKEAMFLSLMLWVAVTTTRFAPFFPAPDFASGVFYPVWWVMVAFGITFVGVTVPGVATVVGGAILKRRIPGIFFGFCLLWIFDSLTRRYLSPVELTPGAVLSVVYVFTHLMQTDKIN